MSVVLRCVKPVLLLLFPALLAACTSTATSPPPAMANLVSEEASASIMRVGYRFKRASEADQIILPPERFIITAIDGAAVNATTTSNIALPVTAGKHSIAVTASGGLLRADSIIDVTISKNKTYQLTGWLNNQSAASFVIWIEDSETSRPASAKISILASRPEKF